MTDWIKPKLITRLPKRLFVFGCSFTQYRWPTWANIIAYDLNIPFYNYGRPGAGNYFIFNMLMQADADYQFNQDDLIIICWTNVAREDRYKNGNWVTPGNIYTQQAFDQKYVQEWADPVSYLIRDFAFIKASWELLDKRACQFHFLKMIDFSQVDQWAATAHDVSDELTKKYEYYLSKVAPSFYKVLWNNSTTVQLRSEDEKYDSKFTDGHPTVKDALNYLQGVFDHEFKQQTIDTVNTSERLLENTIRENIQKKIKAEKMNFENVFFNRSKNINSRE